MIIQLLYNILKRNDCTKYRDFLKGEGELNEVMNERKHIPVSRKCQFLEMCRQLHPCPPVSTLWMFGAPRRTLLIHRTKVVKPQYRITADKRLMNHIFTQSRTSRECQWCGIFLYHWWTASNNPMLLFSHADCASWGISLSSV